MKGFVLFAACVMCAAVLNAADRGVPKTFEQEIAAIRREIAAPGTSGQARHAAYVRLGRLLSLSGDTEGAADAWSGAVYAIEGMRDDAALVEAAGCYAAIGEWDKAENNITLALVTVRLNREALLKAQFIAAQVSAFRSGDTSVLEALAVDADHAARRPSIYLSLARLGAAVYGSRLISEYPDSPEARLLRVEKGMEPRGRVMEASAPQVLLPPGAVQ